MQVVVTGFAHSGSSSVATILGRAGLALGAGPAGGVGGGVEDGCGGTEDADVRRLHRAIVQRHGADLPSTPFPYFVGRDHWHRMREIARRRDLAHDSWGFEDPRALAFLGAWKHVLPDARFVLVVREPGACLAALAACPAEHPDPADALRLWDTQHRSLVAFAGAHRDDCLVLAHDDLAAGRPVLAEIRDRFGVPLDDVADDVAPAPPADPPADRSWRGTPIAARVEQTWHALKDLAARTEFR